MTINKLIGYSFVIIFLRNAFWSLIRLWAVINLSMSQSFLDYDYQTLIYIEDRTWSLLSNSTLRSLHLRSSVFSVQRSSCIGWLPLKVFHQRMSSAKCLLPSNVFFHQMFSSIKSLLPSNDFFLQRLSSIRGCPPTKVSSIKSRLQSKVVFQQRLSSIKGCFTSKVFFHQLMSPIKGVFHQSLSIIKVCLPLKNGFHQMESSI